MTRCVLVTVDLLDADEEQRRDFHAEMERRQWSLMEAKCPAWCAQISGIVSDDDILEVIEEEVTMAAEQAHIYRWDGVCVLEDDTATTMQGCRDAS